MDGSVPRKRELAFAHAQQNGALFHRVQQISQGIVRSLEIWQRGQTTPRTIPAVTPRACTLPSSRCWNS
ncbi:MAG: hypothetical protein ACLSFT_12135 [Ruminococcus callidus]